jgi:hypothetical protein
VEGSVPPRPTKEEQKIRKLYKWSKRNEVVDGIVERLNSKPKYLKGSKSLEQELRSYLEDPVVIPSKLDSSNRANVRKIQKANAKLDARASRVASIQFSIAKVSQLLDRLEVIIRSELYKNRLLDVGSTQPKQKSTVNVVCPQLTEAQTVWKGMEHLCAIVSSRLHESSKSLHRQMKLDENARWADKIAP